LLKEGKTESIINIAYQGIKITILSNYRLVFEDYKNLKEEQTCYVKAIIIKNYIGIEKNKP
tara:strand:- start:30 stop:212 length:183 start_codon:yes stop_codon:yes gene_type:complete